MNYTKEVNGVRYHAKIIGTGPPIVFLHGFTGSGGNWEIVSGMFTDRYKCILIDILGHGKTESINDPDRYKIEKVSKDIVTLLQYIDIKKFHLIGYSMGGRLAIAITALYAKRILSLTLESSSPGLRTTVERRARKEIDENLAKMIESKGIDLFVNYWENTPLFATQKNLPPNVQKLVRTLRLDNNPTGLANSLRGMGTGSQPSYWEILHTIDIPVLLICGEEDQKYCKIAVEMAKKLPNSTIKKIIHVGHTIHVEEPYIFGKIVNEFLQGLVDT